MYLIVYLCLMLSANFDFFAKATKRLGFSFSKALQTADKLPTLRSNVSRLVTN